MTVSSALDRKTFTGNDVTVAFATTPVVFFLETDLQVYVITTATGVSVLQSLTTDYSVAGGAGAVGTVTMLTAPASTETLLIKRVVPATQLADFVNNDASDAEVAEDALDKLTMLAQQLSADKSYPVRISDAETPTTALTVLPFDRAGKVLAFGASKELEAVDGSAGDSGSVALAAALAASTGSALVGTVQSGTGAGPRTMQAKARDLPSVLDFYANGVAGAMVDPTGVVDSTTGLQNAITASAGNVLLWPGQLAGGYLISSALTIAKPLRIIAANGLTDTGNYGARLFTNTAGINLINLAQEATGGNHGFGGSIEGLMLDGNSKAAICLNITGVSTVKWAFHHMNILKATHLGTYILANHTFQFHGCQWALNGITSNLATDGGVQLGGGNEVHFYGCGLEANYGSGMLVSDGYGNGWHGGAIEGNQYHGVIGSSTGQHFTLENAVFEANNEVVAANTFDVDISATTAAHWCLQNLKFSGTNVTNSIRAKGTHTVIRNVRNVSAANKCVLWTSDATKGLMEFDIGAELDPASVINHTVNVACTKVIDTAPQGFSVTTPAVPASTVEQVNTTFVPVDIFITAVGTTTNWSVIDHGGTAQAMGAAVNAGFLCQLPPGHGIKITYSSVPSWKWYGR